jgi:hypothetical protein
VIKDVAVLPLALGGFLALLAAGAVGHALGIPLGIAIGRFVWRVVADFTPPLALWPGHRAARLRPAQILRTE